MAARNGKSKEYWEARCAEVEQIISDCAEAFGLIPVWTLERGHQWMPSDHALLTIKKAKDSVRDYFDIHNRNGFQ